MNTQLGRIGQSPYMDNNNPSNLSSSSSHSTYADTLDESVSDTIMRDLRRVGIKLRHVLIPTDSIKELNDWDLWGPLILCLLLATTLSIGSTHQAALIFTTVFVIIWAGAGVITLNALLLGGNISFLRSVCVLGYCVAPLNVASLFCFLWNNKIYQFILVFLAFIWATRASVGFMAQLVHQDKRLLAVYPILLFYLMIAWMILMQ